METSYIFAPRPRDDIEMLRLADAANILTDFTVG